jgi:hypothetical protein
MSSQRHTTGINRRFRNLIGSLSSNTLAAVFGVLLIGVIGTYLLVTSKAATPATSVEVEGGTLAGGAATKLNDTTASGGKAVKFKQAAVGSHSLKIMPLGDSLTQGGANGGYSGLYPPTINGYRLNLWNLLSDYTIDYVGPYQIGDASLPDHDEAANSGACIKASPCGGGTMYPLTAGWLNTYNPDLVIMQGGGNDYSDHSLTTANIESYMEQWIQLVFQTKPNAKIIVSGTEQWYPDLEAQTKAYVENLQAQGKPIRFVPYGATIDTLDGTHPSPAGFVTWANELAPKVRELYP